MDKLPIRFMSDGEAHESLADVSIPNLLAEKFCLGMKRKMNPPWADTDYDDRIEGEIENELALRMAEDTRLNHTLNSVAVPKGPIKKDAWNGKEKETH